MSAGTGFPYILYDLLKVSMIVVLERVSVWGTSGCWVSRRRRPL